MRDLICAYVVTLDEPYRARAEMSVATLRSHEPDVYVSLIVPGCSDQQQRASATHLLNLVDEVRYVAPLHERSGYFQDNRRYLGDLEAERVLYLDADTFVFGSVRALAERFSHVDVAGRPSPWIWRRGYDKCLAPTIAAPFNGGVLCMSRAFCVEWTADLPRRHAAFLDDPRRRELVAWLRTITPHAYHRDEFVLSELAWSDQWRAAPLGPADCHLLERWPDQEDPFTWLRATVLHTYSREWSACLERLRALVDLPSQPGPVVASG